MDDFMILTLDDYNNIYTKRCADTTTTSDVHHFQTILLKAVPRLPAVSFNNLHINKNIHNPKRLMQNLLWKMFRYCFMYTSRKRLKS